MGTRNRFNPCGPCCGIPPACLILSDDFSSTLPSWTADSGIWTAGVDDISTSSSDAIYQNSTTNSTSYDYVEVDIDASGATLPTEARIIVKYNSSSDYMYGAIRWTSTKEYLIVSDGTTIETREFAAGTISKTTTLRVCFTDHNLAACVKSIDKTVSAYVSDNLANQAGFGTGTLTGGSIAFDNFSYAIHEQIGYASCPACDCSIYYPPCWYCLDGTLPEYLQLTIAGTIANTARCSSCTTYTSTYIVGRSGTCRWDGWFFDGTGCPTDDPQDYIYLSVLLDVDLANHLLLTVTMGRGTMVTGSLGTGLIASWTYDIITNPSPDDCMVILDNVTLVNDNNYDAFYFTCDGRLATCVCDVVL